MMQFQEYYLFSAQFRKIHMSQLHVHSVFPSLNSKKIACVIFQHSNEYNAYIHIFLVPHFQRLHFRYLFWGLIHFEKIHIRIVYNVISLDVTMAMAQIIRQSSP